VKFFFLLFVSFGCPNDPPTVPSPFLAGLSPFSRSTTWRQTSCVSPGASKHAKSPDFSFFNLLASRRVVNPPRQVPAPCVASLKNFTLLSFSDFFFPRTLVSPPFFCCLSFSFVPGLSHYRRSHPLPLVKGRYHTVSFLVGSGGLIRPGVSR